MSNNKFWMYDVTQLFSSFDLLPNSEDSLAEKLNSIMRLTILLCAILSVYKPIIAISTLITVMAITTSVFSATSKQPINEGFQEIQPSPLSVAAHRSHLIDQTETRQRSVTLDSSAARRDESMSLLEFMKEYRSVINQNPPLYKFGFPTTQKRFCNDEVPLNYGPDYVSMNQNLVGGPNMKTTIPPLIAAPSHDSVWKENDFVIQSGINRETNFDYFKAGYNHGTLSEPLPRNAPHPVAGLLCSTVMDRKTEDETRCQLLKEVKKIKLPELIREMRRNNISENEIQDMLDAKIEQFIPQFVYQASRRAEPSLLSDRPWGGEDGSRSDPKGGEPAQRTLRAATESGSSQDRSFQAGRRDNIITQTIQPGVYQKSHVGEPIQSNIGISYTQEFVPTEIDATSNRIKYTQQDPKNLIITPTLRKEVIEQSVENIYDPRFNGYGTSYRSYIDKLTGRPQFYYDDIDSITMPNYITRSNVDIFPWANTYGPDKIIDVETNDEYRQLANNAFHDSAIQFRTELQERLMRKRNAELWQRRIAPITTMKK